MFNILDLTIATLLKDSDDDLLTFSTGTEAKEYINKLVTWSDHKFQPRKVAPGDDSWKLREAAKFESGEYTRVVALENRGLTKPDHFVHLSKKGGVNLAYTKNEEKGRANVQTVISLRGYLETFFSDTVNEEEIEKIKEEQEILIYADALKLAMTPDEIEEAYVNYDPSSEQVANSCMRNAGSDYGGIHPARAYGAGDLAIAHLKNDDGQITHRALVWPEKKLYSRVYGGVALHNLLKNLGYQKSKYYGDGPSMAGAKLLNIPHPSDSRRVIMPYVDEKVAIGDHDDPKYFMFIEPTVMGTVDPHETSGHSYKYSIEVCSRCGVKDRDPRFHTVIINTDMAEAKWCNNCTPKNAFTDFLTQKIYSKDAFRSVQVTVKHPYTSGKYEAMCEETSIRTQPEVYVFCARRVGHAMEKAYANTVVVSKRGETEFWSDAAVENDSWLCEASSQMMSKDLNIINVHTGFRKNGTKIWQRWSEPSVKKLATTVRDRWNRRLYVAKTFVEEHAKHMEELKAKESTLFSY